MMRSINAAVTTYCVLAAINAFTIMKVLSTFLILGAFVAVNATKENGCPKAQEVDWEIEKLLKHEECDKFYKCAHGRPVEMLCNPGLLFNHELSKCDWPQNVDCGDRTIPNPAKYKPQYAELEPSQHIRDTEFLDNGCPVDSRIHWLLPHETNCRQFYACVHGSRLLHTCPGVLHFNSALQVCDLPLSAGCL